MLLLQNGKAKKTCYSPTNEYISNTCLINEKYRCTVIYWDKLFQFLAFHELKKNEQLKSCDEVDHNNLSKIDICSFNCVFLIQQT